MAFAFDSLGYAKRLRDAGIAPDQAEAHAEAARDFMLAELVTRYDLDITRRELESAIDGVRRDLDNVRRDLDIARRELQGSIDQMGLRLTVRMGVMLVAGLTLLGAVLRLH
ncbi:MAG: hypothetical protein JO267_05350 [Alphaproteobacteria bacterium]|nr:hypothetical protein [Alphaproteobacteria bacterium]